MKKSNLGFELQKILEAAKLYRTECRLAILKALATADKPLSQNQIDKKIGKNRFDKVSIYRTLAIFCEKGLIRKAYTQKRAWYFELSHKGSEAQNHPHFTCESCGIISCLPELSIPVVKEIRKGFILHSQQVRLEGLCPDCAVKNAKIP